jgi:hypothetical protein
MQVPAPEAVDIAAKLRVAAVESGRDLRPEWRRAAWRVGAIEHDHRADVLEETSDRLSGEGAERDHLQEPDALALGPQVVDDVLDRSCRRAESDDRTLGVVEAVRYGKRAAKAIDGWLRCAS